MRPPRRDAFGFKFMADEGLHPVAPIVVQVILERLTAIAERRERGR